MAYGLIYEFDSTVGKTEYDAVNQALEIDGSDPKSNWPEGQISHAAGITPEGNFMVYEVWASKAQQEAFMASRLGPALGTVGVSAPLRVIEVDLVNHQVF